MSEASEKPEKPRGRWSGPARWVLRLAAAGFLAACGSLDYWLPALGARWAGIGLASRETRVGRTVTATEVRWANDLVAVEAERLQISAPWRVIRRGKLHATGGDWTVTVTPGSEESNTTERSAWESLVPLLTQIAEVCRARVGEISLADGRLLVAGETILVTSFTLKGDEVKATLSLRGQTVEFAGEIGTGDLALEWKEGGAVLVGAYTAERFSGQLIWLENAARFDGTFAAGKWEPETLSVEGTDWVVPAGKLGLGENYADLRGAFSARKEGDRVNLAVGASALPRTAGFPLAKIELGAEVSGQGVKISRLEIEAPQARATLSETVEWRAGEGLVDEEGLRFEWSADLAPLTGGTVRGLAQGEGGWTSAGEEPGRVEWSAQITGGEWGEWRGVDGVARGWSNERATRVDELRLTLAEGGKVDGRGEYHYQNGGSFVGVELEGSMPGTALAKWLPDDLKIGAANWSAKADGPWSEADWTGRLALAGLVYAGWSADHFSAEAVGKGHNLFRGDWEAAKGEAKVSGQLAGDLSDGVSGTLKWTRGDGRALASERVSIGGWSGAGVSIDARLSGVAGEEISLDWRAGGALALKVQKMDTAWLHEWRSVAGLPAVSIVGLEAEAGYGADGILVAGGKWDATWQQENGRAIRVRGEVAAGPDGAKIDLKVAGLDGVNLMSGEGVVPWRLRSGDIKEEVPGGRWTLQLESMPGAPKWEELAERYGLVLERPLVRLGIGGPAAAPEISGELSVERIALRGDGLPEGGMDLRKVRIEATGGRKEIVLSKIEALVDGQPIEGRLSARLAERDWDELRKRPWIWVRDHASGRISLADADVAALARYMPTVLAPQGKVAADITLTPGANLDGVFRLQGGALRPLGGFGVLNGIDVTLELNGHDVRIGKMRAQAGGREIQVSGAVRRQPGRAFGWDLAVKAGSFPLVRRPGLVLRGDVDLSIKTGATGVTRIGGEVRLRDGLFLADIRPLIPTGGGSGAPLGRPPYFSVETMPLADWELALKVRGDDFLRMRMPIFQGVGSARFDLTGTLREPRATGEFWVERGTILFPFASFAVQEGVVRLRPEDPFTPQLDFRASGRRLGYELRLELSGTASAPQLQFYSSPPLESDRLVLMVTTGAAPQSDQGSGFASQRLASVGAYVGRDLLRTLGLGGDDPDRLSISSGERISRRGKETYGFEYFLDEKWSLSGEYDEFDAYNVGVKRRFRATPDTEGKDDAR